jgi:transcriptional regulator with XRE-family HTH domain/tetratricopeptide (TPR) repeat protein
MSAERSAVTSGPVSGPGQAGATTGPPGRQETAVARKVRARALVAGSAPADIAAEIVSQCGSSRIRAFRLALGIALADVVAQVRARYEADGRPAPRFSETLLSAYEGGQKRPGAEYLHYLCAIYQADPADLGFAGRCLCGQSHRRPGRAGQAARRGPGRPAAHPAAGGAPASPRPPASGPPRLAAVALPGPGAPGHEDDELRNMLLRQMAEPATQVDSGFLGAVDRIRRRMDEVLFGGTVSASMIDRWEEGTAGYGRQYMTVPPQRLLCDVLLDFADVRRKCEDRQPLEFAERLCRLASQLAGLAGIAMLDLGDHRLARSFFRTARTAADETGDRHLRAWVAVREALVPLYYGDPREAASLAGAASDLAGRQLCVAAAMAPVIEARAQARLAAMAALGPRGRRETLCRVRASLDRAHDVLGDLPDEQRRDTALGYTERQLYFHTGDTLVALGDWQGASRAFSQASQMYASSEVLDCALIALGQARCLLESDEPGQALAAGQRTVSQLPAEHRTDVLLQVARVLGQLAAERDPALAGLAGYREALATA